MQNHNTLRTFALPFMIVGVGLTLYGFNSKNNVLLYAGVAAMAAGLAFLKASVWNRPKESRRWKKREDKPPPQ